MAMATASDVEDQRSEQELLGSAPSRVSRMRWVGLGLALLVTFVVGILVGRETRKPSAATMLGALVQKFDAEDLEHHVHKAFQLYDADNNGHLSMQEFGQIIKDASEETRQPPILHEHLQAMFNHADDDGSGKIEVGELKALLVPALTQMKSQS